MTDPSPGFSAVPWLAPFRLVPEVLLEDVLEVTLAPDAMLPFSRLRPDAAAWCFRPDPPGEAAGLAERLAPEALREALSVLPATDLSRGTRARRWTLVTALAAAEATRSLRRLGSMEAWLEHAALERRRTLAAVDAGLPPDAATLAGTCRMVPHALRHLGKALPTAEAVRLLAPLGRICELGAGFGLFARALERAGMLVAASDPDASGNTGIAFPVRKGFDAAATLAAFAALGPLPPLLIVWPQPDEGAWFAEVFAGAAPGQLIAMASPELEFCRLGGLDAAAPMGSAERAHTGPGWLAAADLAARLAAEFEELGAAPVVAAGWPMQATPLRLWRRR